MPIFTNRIRPRSLEDIKIGSSHSCEVLFHLRRQDWDWYINNEDEIEEEIFDLLSDRIIPRMFGKEIEYYHAKRHPEKFPDIVVEETGTGSKNIKNAAKAAAAAGNNTKKGGGRQPKPKKKMSTAAKKKAAAAAALANQDDNRPEKDVYFSFGEVVQLAYRIQPLPSSMRTIWYKDENANKDASDGKEGEEDTDEKQRQKQVEVGGGFFEGHRTKLKSRLLIWVSKIDPTNKTNPDAPGIGFYRPEFVPTCQIFKEPQDSDGSD